MRMPVYRVDRTVNEDRWWIQKVTKGMLTFNHNIIYDTDIEIDKGGPTPTVPGEIVWVEQPTPLAAFSQALMIFNGEMK
jgi:hypothetical protein